jgi:hypothetical protein
MTWQPHANNRVVDRQEVLNVLNAIPGVVNWRASIGAIFIISSLSATALSAQLRQKLPGLQHMIAPIDIAVTDGWADADTWSFLQYPSAAR